MRDNARVRREIVATFPELSDPIGQRLVHYFAWRYQDQAVVVMRTMLDAEFLAIRNFGRGFLARLRQVVPDPHEYWTHGVVGLQQERGLNSRPPRIMRLGGQRFLVEPGSYRLDEDPTPPDWRGWTAYADMVSLTPEASYG